MDDDLVHDGPTAVRSGLLAGIINDAERPHVAATRRVSTTEDRDKITDNTINEASNNQESVRP